MPGFVSRLLRGEGFGAGGARDLGGEGRAKSKAGRLGRRRRRAAPRRQTARRPARRAGRAAGAPRELKADGVAGEKRRRRTTSERRQRRTRRGLRRAASGAPPQARKDFRDSALWTAEVATDASGTATVKVPFPESLTTWRAKAWAWTHDTLVGQATADVKTTKDVLVRLRAPRFFVEGDSITVAALVNNRTDKRAERAREAHARRAPRDARSRSRSTVEVPAERGPPRRLDGRRAARPARRRSPRR